jgi:hypothetical protein
MIAPFLDIDRDGRPEKNGPGEQPPGLIFKSPVSADDLVMVGKFLVDVAQRARTAVAEKIWLENELHRFGFDWIDFVFCAALLGAANGGVARSRIPGGRFLSSIGKRAWRFPSTHIR